ncbi:MAG: hypothetical protein HGA45_32085 [Chloroflexales bacterium]|nr:hypothetical protein [Chloroflexales bacterium]
MNDTPAPKTAILWINDRTREPGTLVPILVDAGYHISVAADPREALGIFCQERPALILVSATPSKPGDEQAWRDLAAAGQAAGASLLIAAAPDELPALLLQRERAELRQVEVELRQAHEELARLHVAMQHMTTPLPPPLWPATPAEPGPGQTVPDLVDTITQILFAAGLIAEGLPAAFQRSASQAQHGLDELRRLIRSALGEAYSLQLELRPGALQSRPLAEVLRHLAVALRHRTSVEVVAPDDTPCVLPPEVHSTLYRIAYETLHALNITSGDAHVTIELRCQPEAVTLQLASDKGSLDPAADEQARGALERIRARAAIIGAALEHTSKPPQGALILVRWAPGLAADPPAPAA